MTSCVLFTLTVSLAAALVAMAVADDIEVIVFRVQALRLPARVPAPPVLALAAQACGREPA